MEGEYTATIDRIVDGETAVLLLEDDGDVIEQFDVPVTRLPTDAAAGAVVSVTVDDDEVVSISARPEATADRSERIREKLDRLSKRLDDRD